MDELSSNLADANTSNGLSQLDMQINSANLHFYSPQSSQSFTYPPSESLTTVKNDSCAESNCPLNSDSASNLNRHSRVEQTGRQSVLSDLYPPISVSYNRGKTFANHQYAGPITSPVHGIVACIMNDSDNRMNDSLARPPLHKPGANIPPVTAAPKTDHRLSSRYDPRVFISARSVDQSTGSQSSKLNDSAITNPSLKTVPIRKQKGKSTQSIVASGTKLKDKIKKVRIKNTKKAPHVKIKRKVKSLVKVTRSHQVGLPKLKNSIKKKDKVNHSSVVRTSLDTSRKNSSQCVNDNSQLRELLTRTPTSFKKRKLSVLHYKKQRTTNNTTTAVGAKILPYSFLELEDILTTQIPNKFNTSAINSTLCTLSGIPPSDSPLSKTTNTKTEPQLKIYKNVRSKLNISFVDSHGKSAREYLFKHMKVAGSQSTIVPRLFQNACNFVNSTWRTRKEYVQQSSVCIAKNAKDHKLVSTSSSVHTTKWRGSRLCLKVSRTSRKKSQTGSGKFRDDPTPVGVASMLEETVENSELIIIPSQKCSKRQQIENAKKNKKLPKKRITRFMRKCRRSSIEPAIDSGHPPGFTSTYTFDMLVSTADAEKLDTNLSDSDDPSYDGQPPKRRYQRKSGTTKPKQDTFGALDERQWNEFLNVHQHLFTDWVTLTTRSGIRKKIDIPHYKDFDGYDYFTESDFEEMQRDERLCVYIEIVRERQKDIKYDPNNPNEYRIRNPPYWLSPVPLTTVNIPSITKRIQIIYKKKANPMRRCIKLIRRQMQPPTKNPLETFDDMPVACRTENTEFDLLSYHENQTPLEYAQCSFQEPAQIKTLPPPTQSAPLVNCEPNETDPITDNLAEKESNDALDQLLQANLYPKTIQSISNSFFELSKLNHSLNSNMDFSVFASKDSVEEIPPKHTALSNEPPLQVESLAENIPETPKPRTSRRKQIHFPLINDEVSITETAAPEPNQIFQNEIVPKINCKIPPDEIIGDKLVRRNKRRTTRIWDVPIINEDCNQERVKKRRNPKTISSKKRVRFVLDNKESTVQKRRTNIHSNKTRKIRTRSSYERNKEIDGRVDRVQSPILTDFIGWDASDVELSRRYSRLEAFFDERLEVDEASASEIIAESNEPITCLGSNVNVTLTDPIAPTPCINCHPTESSVNMSIEPDCFSGYLPASEHSLHHANMNADLDEILPYDTFKLGSDVYFNVEDTIGKTPGRKYNDERNYNVDFLLQVAAETVLAPVNVITQTELPVKVRTDSCVNLLQKFLDECGSVAVAREKLAETFHDLRIGDQPIGLDIVEKRLDVTANDRQIFFYSPARRAESPSIPHTPSLLSPVPASSEMEVTEALINDFDNQKAENCTTNSALLNESLKSMFGIRDFTPSPPGSHYDLYDISELSDSFEGEMKQVTSDNPVNSLPKSEVTINSPTDSVVDERVYQINGDTNSNLYSKSYSNQRQRPSMIIDEIHATPLSPSSQDNINYTNRDNQVVVDQTHCNDRDIRLGGVDQLNFKKDDGHINSLAEKNGIDMPKDSLNNSLNNYLHSPIPFEFVTKNVEYDKPYSSEDNCKNSVQNIPSIDDICEFGDKNNDKTVEDSMRSRHEILNEVSSGIGKEIDVIISYEKVHNIGSKCQMGKIRNKKKRSTANSATHDICQIQKPQFINRRKINSKFHTFKLNQASKSRGKVNTKLMAEKEMDNQYDEVPDDINVGSNLVIGDAEMDSSEEEWIEVVTEPTSNKLTDMDRLVDLNDTKECYEVSVASQKMDVLESVVRSEPINNEYWQDPTEDAKVVVAGTSAIPIIEQYENATWNDKNSFDHNVRGVLKPANAVLESVQLDKKDENPPTAGVKWRHAVKELSVYSDTPNECYENTLYTESPAIYKSEKPALPKPDLREHINVESLEEMVNMGSAEKVDSVSSVHEIQTHFNIFEDPTYESYPNAHGADTSEVTKAVEINDYESQAVQPHHNDEGSAEKDASYKLISNITPFADDIPLNISDDVKKEEQAALGAYFEKVDSVSSVHEIQTHFNIFEDPPYESNQNAHGADTSEVTKPIEINDYESLAIQPHHNDEGSAEKDATYKRISNLTPVDEDIPLNISNDVKKEVQAALGAYFEPPLQPMVAGRDTKKVQHVSTTRKRSHLGKALSNTPHQNDVSIPPKTVNSNKSRRHAKRCSLEDTCHHRLEMTESHENQKEVRVMTPQRNSGVDVRVNRTKNIHHKIKPLTVGSKSDSQHVSRKEKGNDLKQSNRISSTKHLKRGKTNTLNAMNSSPSQENAGETAEAVNLSLEQTDTQKKRSVEMVITKLKEVINSKSTQDDGNALNPPIDKNVVNGKQTALKTPAKISAEREEQDLVLTIPTSPNDRCEIGLDQFPHEFVPTDIRDEPVKKSVQEKEGGNGLEIDSTTKESCDSGVSTAMGVLKCEQIESNTTPEVEEETNVKDVSWFEKQNKLVDIKSRMLNRQNKKAINNMRQRKRKMSVDKNLRRNRCRKRRNELEKLIGNTTFGKESEMDSSICASDIEGVHKTRASWRKMLLSRSLPSITGNKHSEKLLVNEKSIQNNDIEEVVQIPKKTTLKPKMVRNVKHLKVADNINANEPKRWKNNGRKTQHPKPNLNDSTYLINEILLSPSAHRITRSRIHSLIQNGSPIKKRFRRNKDNGSNAEWNVIDMTDDNGNSEITEIELEVDAASSVIPQKMHVLRDRLECDVYWSPKRKKPTAQRRQISPCTCQEESLKLSKKREERINLVAIVAPPSPISAAGIDESLPGDKIDASSSSSIQHNISEKDAYSAKLCLASNLSSRRTLCFKGYKMLSWVTATSPRTPMDEQQPSLAKVLCMDELYAMADQIRESNNPRSSQVIDKRRLSDDVESKHTSQVDLQMFSDSSGVISSGECTPPSRSEFNAPMSTANSGDGDGSLIIDSLPTSDQINLSQDLFELQLICAPLIKTLRPSWRNSSGILKHVVPNQSYSVNDSQSQSQDIAHSLPPNSTPPPSPTSSDLMGFLTSPHADLSFRRRLMFANDQHVWVAFTPTPGDNSGDHPQRTNEGPPPPPFTAPAPPRRKLASASPPSSSSSSSGDISQESDFGVSDEDSDFEAFKHRNFSLPFFTKYCKAESPFQKTKKYTNAEILKRYTRLTSSTTHEDDSLDLRAATSTTPSTGSATVRSAATDRLLKLLQNERQKTRQLLQRYQRSDATPQAAIPQNSVIIPSIPSIPNVARVRRAESTTRKHHNQRPQTKPTIQPPPPPPLEPVAAPEELPSMPAPEQLPSMPSEPLPSSSNTASASAATPNSADENVTMTFTKSKNGRNVKSLKGRLWLQQNRADAGSNEAGASCDSVDSLTNPQPSCSRPPNERSAPPPPVPDSDSSDSSDDEQYCQVLQNLLEPKLEPQERDISLMLEQYYTENKVFQAMSRLEMQSVQATESSSSLEPRRRLTSFAPELNDLHCMDVEDLFGPQTARNNDLLQICAQMNVEPRLVDELQLQANYWPNSKQETVMAIAEPRPLSSCFEEDIEYERAIARLFQEVSPNHQGVLPVVSASVWEENQHECGDQTIEVHLDQAARQIWHRIDMMFRNCWASGSHLDLETNDCVEFIGFSAPLTTYASREEACASSLVIEAGPDDRDSSKVDDAKITSNDDGPIKEDKRGKKKKLLLARSHTGEFIGLKYDMDRPDLFENEMARVQWTLSSIRNILRYKSQVERGEVVPRSSDVVNSPNLTPEERILAIEKCVVKRKQERLAWLQTESKLVECDSEIKSHLGLEKANPELALACLEKIAVLNIEQLMLTKHPHVVDMVKRLRRYIGNVKQWNLSPEKTAEFIQGAEKIRKKADVVYQKFKNLYELHPEKTFTDVYMGHVEEFNTQTKHMREAAKFAVCAKPGTHQFEMDQLDDKMESDAIKLKSQLEKKRLHIETDDQHELEDYET